MMTKEAAVQYLQMASAALRAEGLINSRPGHVSDLERQLVVQLASAMMTGDRLLSAGNAARPITPTVC